MRSFSLPLYYLNNHTPMAGMQTAAFYASPWEQIGLLLVILLSTLIFWGLASVIQGYWASFRRRPVAVPRGLLPLSPPVVRGLLSGPALEADRKLAGELARERRLRQKLWADQEMLLAWAGDICRADLLGRRELCSARRPSGSLGAVWPGGDRARLDLALDRGIGLWAEHWGQLRRGVASLVELRRDILRCHGHRLSLGQRRELEAGSIIGLPEPLWETSPLAPFSLAFFFSWAWAGVMI